MAENDEAWEVPDAALAFRLAEAAADGLLFVDAGGARLDRLARIAAAFAPALEILLLPAWDSSPWDRMPASAAVVGQRVQALARLAEAPDQPRLLLTSARALLQRVPPRTHWSGALLALRPGDALDEAALRTRLAAFGYTFDERVDRVGEVALRGHVIDVFPGGVAHPARIEVADGAVAALHVFDPATQRTLRPLDALVMRPVVEAEPAPEWVEAEAQRMAEPDLADDAEPPPTPVPPTLGRLEASVFDYLGKVRAVVHPAVAGRLTEIAEEMEEAHAAALVVARGAASGQAVPRPGSLYLAPKTVLNGLGKLPGAALPLAAETVPPPASLDALLTQVRASRGTVTIAAGSAAAQLGRALRRRGIEAAMLDVEIPEGFRIDGLDVLAAPPALLRPGGTHRVGPPLEEPPRLADIVVHEEHGVCRLVGLRSVGAEERLALAFHEGTELLVPISDLVRLWRYGSDSGAVALDRLHGEAWGRRRREIEAEVAETAAALSAAAQARAATRAPVVALSGAALRTFRRVVERFAFTPSADQAAAIDDVLGDLGAGRPMDRLVCGDVGFGKTEVALRAAAAAALAGYQVAIVAPTTVLARQHVETVRRRLAGTGIRVEPLLRGATGASAKPVRDGLADGSVGVVVGTQAVASDAVRFHRLGLVVIDEEQRFGDADKRRLAALKSRDGAVHVMVMTATPIPRTLQAAMVGLRDISVIATAPVRRQPTRTVVLPWSEAVVHEALMREHARGGQSFVVAPRIEALAELEASLRRWVPTLSLGVAHGRLKPAALERVVGDFAAGATDVLLATNIIEAGLDIPRANTILVTGPHRFGLAQLHQMRGRVGRGERRGIAYVLTDPGVRLAAPTVRRLAALETLEGLGAGVSIAAADMDARGAGDLFGDQQAGHVHAIGTEFYQHILARELARLEGHKPPAPWPELKLGIEGRIPEDYVPESNLRLALYRRLARLADRDALDDFAAELVDRFGPVPAALSPLLDAARLRVWCMEHGVSTVEAGPKATALTTQDAATLADRIGGTAKGGRVLAAVPGADGAARLHALLDGLGG